MKITLAPLLSDAYVANMQRGNRDAMQVMGAYAARVRILMSSGKYDLLWIEKEAFPWLPFGIENLFLQQSVPYVLDYDDADFHSYDEHDNRLVRALLAPKHPNLMQRAALVVAGNAYLADFARQAGAPHVALVPTVIDLERYPDSAHKQPDGEQPCIGWIGQRATAHFLAPYAPLFERLAGAGLARFAAIGIDTAKLGLPMASVPWAENTEVASIAALDVGIMPLLDGSFERGKCGYKLIQYMACGLPVVASPVGVNRQIVEHGVNGFLAETPEQWEQALRTLLADADLRQRMGQAGRKKVEKEYSLQVTAPILVNLLFNAARKG